MVRRLVGVCLAVVAVVALAGCGAGDPTAQPTGAGSGSSSPGVSSPGASTSTTSAGATVPVADPSHAVPAPGPRSGELHSADILVRAGTTLTAAQLAIAAPSVDAFLWIERPWQLPKNVAKGTSSDPGFKMASAVNEARFSRWNPLTQGAVQD